MTVWLSHVTSCPMGVMISCDILSNGSVIISCDILSNDIVITVYHVTILFKDSVIILSDILSNDWMIISCDILSNVSDYLMYPV